MVSDDIFARFLYSAREAEGVAQEDTTRVRTSRLASAKLHSACFTLGKDFVLKIEVVFLALRTNAKC